MGLDVYLYKMNAPRAEIERLRDLSEKISQEANDEAYDNKGESYSEYEKRTTEEERDRTFEKYKELKRSKAAAHGLTIDEKWCDVLLPEEKVEIDSKRDPKHYFKIGYFRSSYNNGGINHVLRNLLGAEYGLGWIFDNDEEYYLYPDWKRARTRAEELLKLYQASSQKCPASVTTVTCVTEPCRSEEEALRMFQEVYDAQIRQTDPRKQCHGMTAFSNKHGLFDMTRFMTDPKTFDGEKAEPMQIVAVIPGVQESIMAKVMGRNGVLEPCAYVITKKDVGPEDWYAKALMIVIETIDYVLAQEKPEQFYLHWSG